MLQHLCLSNVGAMPCKESGVMRHLIVAHVQASKMFAAVACTWRRGKETGMYPGKPFCNACGTNDKRYGPEYDPEEEQVTHTHTHHSQLASQNQT